VQCSAPLLPQAFPEAVPLADVLDRRHLQLPFGIVGLEQVLLLPAQLRLELLHGDLQLIYLHTPRPTFD
jgi:hypothetical protein